MSTHPNPLTYMVANATADIRLYNIGGTLDSVPYPRAWGGPLWTLKYELLCYLAVGLAAVVIRNRRWVFPEGVFALTAASAAGIGASGDLYWLLLLGSFFAAGGMLWHYSGVVPLNARWAAGVSVALAALVNLQAPAATFALPVAYLCMWAGVALPLRSLGQKRDLSYGVYIYGWTVGQMLAVFGAEQWGVWPYLLLTIAATLPLAWLSWTFVESPALRLKSWNPWLAREPLTGVARSLKSVPGLDSR